MVYWIKRLIIAIILAGLAFAAIDNIDFLMSLDKQTFTDDVDVKKQSSDNNKSTEENTAKESSSETPPKTVKKNPPKKIESKNAAAEGLSKFYASINSKDDGKGPKIKNGIVFLPDPTGDLDKIMIARRKVIRPLPKKWHGIKKSRAFRKGHTLYQKLTEYAKEDGLQVIWRLNRDLLVKDSFRIDKDILKIAHKIGLAINGYFPGGVSTYFCNKHRAIVLMEYTDKYLDKHCILLNEKYKP